MPNFMCLRHCIQDKMQVSQNFTDTPRIWPFLSCGSQFWYKGGMLYSERGKFAIKQDFLKPFLEGKEKTDYLTRTTCTNTNDNFTSDSK